MSPEKFEGQDTLELRVARHDAEIAAIREDVNDIKSSQHEMSNKLDLLLNRIATSGKTQWGQLAAWAGVILLAMGFIVSRYVDDQVELKREVVQLQAAELDNAYQMGQRDSSLEFLKEKIDISKDKLVGEIYENKHELDLMWQESFDRWERMDKVEAKVDILYNERYKNQN